MHASVQTVTFAGIVPQPIEVQCSLQSGVPSFTIVGLADRAVSEARDRIRAVFATLHLAFPAKRVTINLAPAHLPKSGPQFDLPIALALLTALEILPAEALKNALALGELSLDGRVLPVTGCLPAALSAAERDLTFLCPAANASEAALIENCAVFGAAHLLDLIKHLTAERLLLRAVPMPLSPVQNQPDMEDVRGQFMPKRALEIAAAGGHNVLMIGPPGAGKSMLAKCFSSILPAPSAQELLETAMVHSLAGLLAPDHLPYDRPFRAPHHGASMAALIGGGRSAKPGEASLAHNGVLFLDELPEFQRPVLDALREPLETHHINLARADARVTYPARMMLLAAANPCRCGHAYDAGKACSRAPSCSEDYLKKLSGPLLDRFDIRLSVQPLEISSFAQTDPAEPSQDIRARVEKARKRQRQRGGALRNAESPLSELEAQNTPEAQEIALKAAKQFQLTARGYHRILRVARTIADLAASDQIERPHILEALALRGE